MLWLESANAVASTPPNRLTLRRAATVEGAPEHAASGVAAGCRKRQSLPNQDRIDVAGPHALLRDHAGVEARPKLIVAAEEGRDAREFGSPRSSNFDSCREPTDSVSAVMLRNRRRSPPDDAPAPSA